MEPGLGLGIVELVAKRHVDIRFPASRSQRRYAIETAPLRRVEFKPGDMIKSKSGFLGRITAVAQEYDLFIYDCIDAQVAENDLDDHLSFTTPQTRMQSGFVDRNRDFNLRYRTLILQHNSLKSPVRGFLGGRIDLIPHQLYIARQVVNQITPRVLLSDETGLGKTIEACLILHHLLLNGRIGRALILVPETLVHQWFIELYRKFNLFFRIIDEPYCRALQEADPDFNPFLDDQLIICSQSFLVNNADRAEQALAAGWDILVIDEAHHLTQGSADYGLAVRLSAICPFLILLTATPEQLGHSSHFARLALLDPARYSDYQTFEQEEKQYLKISQLVDKIFHSAKLTATDKQALAGLLSVMPEDKNECIQMLVDRHGTGRSVFRNTRQSVTGFPSRNVCLFPLPAGKKDLEQLTAEFAAFHLHGDETTLHLDYQHDPRLLWLVSFLRKHRGEKLLLICRSLLQVRAVEEALRKHMKVEIALFHEGLSLLQRDRYAAWFAKKEGAQICLCSEIGSEGRNFQFAHHLVLFDLPLDPELLEQRIGRLDRIGQTQTIHVHIPYLIGGEYEILALWYHEGLGAFSAHVPGVYQIYVKLADKIKRISSARRLQAVQQINLETRKLVASISKKVAAGRDRLLELNSFQPEIAEPLQRLIMDNDAKPTLEKYMLDVFELYDLRLQEQGYRTWHVDALLLSNPEFPLPMAKDEEFSLTFDRTAACKREDIEFITWDHPMVSGVFDMILASEKGNCAYAVWDNAGKEDLIMEAIFILESVADRSLTIERFLPPRPVRIFIDSSFQECAPEFSGKSLHDPDDNELSFFYALEKNAISHMLDNCEKIAKAKVGSILDSVTASIRDKLDHEQTRLTELAKVNKHIKTEEIARIRKQKEAMIEAVQSARIRLDSLRLIQCIPFKSSVDHVH